jgi:hypothetical protein
MCFGWAQKDRFLLESWIFASVAVFGEERRVDGGRLPPPLLSSLELLKPDHERFTKMKFEDETFIGGEIDDLLLGDRKLKAKNDPGER